MPFTKEGTYTGTITYYRDNFGLVKVANLYKWYVWFESEAVIGQIPQVNDRVSLEAKRYTPSWTDNCGPLHGPWYATRIQVLPNSNPNADPCPSSDEQSSEPVIPNTPNVPSSLLSLKLNPFLAQDDHAKENNYRTVTGPKFTKGEKVLCCNILSPLLIEAKCQGYNRVQYTLNTYEYSIHYLGWNKSWNEWVPESQILKTNSENRMKMEKLKTEYPVHMLCANLLQCLEKNYNLAGGGREWRAISNLENCNVTFEDLAATQLIKHVTNLNIALKSFTPPESFNEAHKKLRILFKNQLLPRTENLVKKWCGIVNSSGLAQELLSDDDEPYIPENFLPAGQHSHCAQQTRLAEAISKFLPETETRLVETSESPLPATKKPKLETQNCLETENEELKNSVDYLKTKVECLTKENNELKLNYRRISDQNRRLTKEFQTFTNNVNEVKATNTGNGNSLISVKLEEEDTRIKNEIEMIDCEDIKEEEIEIEKI